MTHILMVLLIAMTTGQDSMQPAAKPDPELVYAMKGAQHLRFLTNDPDTFKLNLALITFAGNICYEYQARNDLGATDRQTAVFLKSARKLTDDDAKFVSMDSSDWKHYCVEGTTFKWHLRAGRNVTQDVNKTLKSDSE
jgi:hypothetical protein